MSYFGSRILRYVVADMKGLADLGYTGVLHTFSENDLAYYREQMGRIVAASHDAGLEVQLGPWGVGGVFGGEAESIFAVRHPELGQVFASGRRVASPCPTRPEFRDYARSWATAAVEAGADRIFWDEPHWAHPRRFDEPEVNWTCVCSSCRSSFSERFGSPMPASLAPEVRAFREQVLVELLTDLVGHVRSLGGRSTICLLPPVAGLHVGIDGWAVVAAIDGLDTLATDPYWSVFGLDAAEFVGGQSHRLAALAASHRLTPQIWIQGYGLGPEQVPEIHTAVAAARAAGVEDLWTWGYEACGHMTYLATRDPGRVWNVLTAALVGGPVDG
ncbi:MAG: hypothetical protein ACRDWI_20035 [Jiangellaceae bacterium]